MRMHSCVVELQWRLNMKWMASRLQRWLTFDDVIALRPRITQCIDVINSMSVVLHWYPLSCSKTPSIRLSFDLCNLSCEERCYGRRARWDSKHSSSLVRLSVCRPAVVAFCLICPCSILLRKHPSLPHRRRLVSQITIFSTKNVGVRCLWSHVVCLMSAVYWHPTITVMYRA